MLWSKGWSGWSLQEVVFARDFLSTLLVPCVMKFYLFACLSGADGSATLLASASLFLFIGLLL